MLNEIDNLPDGLLETPADRLADLLGGPTLMHLPGRQPEPLFISVLAHGNETTGYYAVQSLLQKYHDGELPRAVSVFFANVSAAAVGQRRLDGQADYNRVWPGTPDSELPEAAMMQQVVNRMRERTAFASIDVHNNTGINPHYACINRIDNQSLQLAALYSRTVVYFIRPLGVQSMAMASVCPAVTIECGKTEHEYGMAHARDYLDACLHLHEIPQQPVASHDIDLFHTVAVVKVPEHVSFGFGDVDAELQLLADLDHLNFRELPAGSRLAALRGAGETVLEVRDDNDQDVFGRYFSIEDGVLSTAKPLMPSMFTLDERVIRQDCLGYLMERLLPEQP